MAKKLQKALAELDGKRRKRIESRFEELIEEVQLLADLRRRVRLSQQSVAEELGISQPAVSKLERQSDMYLSTLRNYCRAIGAELEIHVRLPGNHRVQIQSLEELTTPGSK